MKRPDLKALRAAAKETAAWARRRDHYELAYACDRVAYAIYELTRPENSREEVAPMGRSPQRDCRTITLVPPTRDQTDYLQRILDGMKYDPRTRI